jgi:hypothetical protein
LPLIVGFFVSAFFPFVFVDLKSSGTGGKASPPLTASSLEGSVGFISIASCSPVTGLSGFSAGRSWPNRPSPGFLSGVPTALSTAPSGDNRRFCCSLTVLFRSLSAPSPSISEKLPLLIPVLPLSSTVAMPPANSTGIKLALTLLLGLCPFSLSLPPTPLGLLPLESGELESREVLFSNKLRRLRTAEGARFSEDMAAVAIKGSVNAFWLNECRYAWWNCCICQPYSGQGQKVVGSAPDAVDRDQDGDGRASVSCRKKVGFRGLGRRAYRTVDGPGRLPAAGRCRNPVDARL